MDAILKHSEAAKTSILSSNYQTKSAVASGTISSTICAQEALPKVATYLRDIYYWAYLNPRNVRFLDNEFVVSAILWFQHRRLQREAFAEITPGFHVLQSASVYGNFLPDLARHVGPQGRLEVADIARIQVASCRRKLRGFKQASARRADARNPGGGPYNAINCYFLMHELPEDYKHDVVDALLANVGPGGKVIFVDYHKPHWAHPLKGIMSLIFDTLEPFAKSLWHHEIADFAADRDAFHWRKNTYFGGLYQKVVAERR